MSGAITPLPSTPSWRGDQLKNTGQIYFCVTSRELWLKYKYRIFLERLFQTDPSSPPDHILSVGAVITLSV
jgi:hypothetical protein